MGSLLASERLAASALVPLRQDRLDAALGEAQAAAPDGFLADIEGAHLLGIAPAFARLEQDTGTGQGATIGPGLLDART